MAINIIRDQSLTSQLATGLGTGLQQLAQAKAQQMLARQQQQKTVAGLQGIGLSPQEATGITQLPQELQGRLLQAYLERGGGMGQPGLPAAEGEAAAPQQATFAQTLGKLPLREERKEALERRKFELMEEKEKRRQQEKLSPFLKQEAQDFKVQNQVKHVAEELLANIRKNKKKFPGALLGNIRNIPYYGEQLQSALMRDPDVRKYIADTNKAVILLGQTRKGVPTNYKLRMEAMAKGDISQPIETQEAIWQSIVDEADRTKKRRQYIKQQQDKHGNYPLDLEQKLVDFELAQDNPLEYPEYYEEGTEIEAQGKMYRLTNGEWKEI